MKTGGALHSVISSDNKYSDIYYAAIRLAFRLIDVELCPGFKVLLKHLSFFPLKRPPHLAGHALIRDDTGRRPTASWLRWKLRSYLKCVREQVAT